MNITQIGLSDAAAIPVGAMLDAITWNVPTSYTIGIAFDTRELALIHAINKKKAAVALHNEFYANSSGSFVLLPERITIDLRWTFRFDGGGLDVPIQRTEYATIVDAEESLALIQQYATA